MTSPEIVDNELNRTIAQAVNAKIEASVFAALSGDEAIGKFVTAALMQPVEVGSGYDRKKPVPYLHTVLTKAIQEATKAAVLTWMAENIGDVELEVAKALRRDTKAIAAGLAKSLADVADKAYGVSVTVDLKMPNRD